MFCEGKQYEIKIKYKSEMKKHNKPHYNDDDLKRTYCMISDGVLQCDWKYQTIFFYFARKQFTVEHLIKSL